MIIDIIIFANLKVGKMVNLNNYKVLSKVGLNLIDPMQNTPPPVSVITCKSSVCKKMLLDVMFRIECFVVSMHITNINKIEDYD